MLCLPQSTGCQRQDIHLVRNGLVRPFDPRDQLLQIGKGIAGFTPDDYAVCSTVETAVTSPDFRANESGFSYSDS
jgi:hypothetical protein